MTAAHHERVQPVGDVVEFTVLAESRLGECPLRGHIVRPDAGNNERHCLVEQRGLGHEADRIDPSPRPSASNSPIMMSMSIMIQCLTL
jgi:hypothetical protein